MLHNIFGAAMYLCNVFMVIGFIGAGLFSGWLFYLKKNGISSFAVVLFFNIIVGKSTDNEKDNTCTLGFNAGKPELLRKKNYGNR